MSKPSLFARNDLLNALPEADLEGLAPSLELVLIQPEQVLVEPCQRIQHCYFPVEGMAAIETAQSGHGIEIGCIGSEGMTGTPVLLDLERTPLKTLVRLAGTAYRISSGDLREATYTSPALHRTLLRYCHTLLLQAADAAHASGVYTVPRRLARWLELAFDRAGSNELNVTHEFLALVLGVRRPSITDAMAVLEGEGMIKATRGRVVVRDQNKLLEFVHGYSEEINVSFSRF